MTKDMLELKKSESKVKIRKNTTGIQVIKEEYGMKLEWQDVNRLRDNFHLHEKDKKLAGLYNNRPPSFIKNEHIGRVTETKELL